MSSPPPFYVYDVRDWAGKVADEPKMGCMSRFTTRARRRALRQAAMPMKRMVLLNCSMLAQPMVMLARLTLLAGHSRLVNRH